MYTIKQPNHIIFGKNAIDEFSFENNCLIITSPGARARGWLNLFKIPNYFLYENVCPNPSIELVDEIISNFSSSKFSTVIGIGGGSVLDIAKYVAFKLNKFKILIPTTFGSGSEVTRISVLKVNNQKKSFHDDDLFADIAIVDPRFLENSDFNIIKNSAIDALAQCSEAYDSKISNQYTKYFCNIAFNILEESLLTKNYLNLSLGSLYSGIGFGNSSTTLGHALSYVFSNENIGHGHALAFTTLFAHKFNESIFAERFEKIIKSLKFSNIKLHQNLEDAADLILDDHKHLDNNPKPVSKIEIVELFEKINDFSI